MGYAGAKSDGNRIDGARCPKAINSLVLIDSVAWVELRLGDKDWREEGNLRGWRELSRWLEFDDDCWKRATTNART